MNRTIANVSLPYPLSNSQRNIWNLEQSFPGTSINNICETIRIRGNFDIALVQQCLNLILEADSSLRAQIFLDENGCPVQHQMEYEPCQFPVFDFSSTDEDGIRHWETSVTRKVMPLLNSPLFFFAVIRVGEHEGGILVKTHHLISDGWSQVSLINRIAQTYLALTGGTVPVLEPSPSYQQHVESEQAYLTSHAFEKDRAFWMENMADPPQPISIKDCSSAQISQVGQRKSFCFSEVLNHAMYNFCTKHSVAPFAVFYMAIAIYLKRMKGADRICIGAPIHNRMTASERLTTGMFVSTLPFLVEIDENWSFETFNEKIADWWLELLRHQRYPYPLIASAAKDNGGPDRLFDLVLSFHNSRIISQRDTSIQFSGQWHYAGYQAEHICIHLNNMENERRYSVNYDYLTQIFSEKEIEDFHYYLTNILREALLHPERPIWQLPVLPPGETEKVLFTFNRTEAISYDGTFHQKFLQVCQEHPHRVAVIDSGIRYTYTALKDHANGIAGKIAQRLSRSGEAVAILLPKGYPLFAAMAGVAQSGNAWVLLAPELPPQRILDILENSGAKVILSSAGLLERFGLAGGAIPTICLDVLPDSGEDSFFCPASPSDLAYIVYTSGSTGKPKGVEVEHRSLLNFAEAMKPIYAHGAVLSLCSISFDAFLLESAVSLLNGRTIVLPAEGEQEDPVRLGELIRRYAVGFLATTPSRLAAFLRIPAFAGACRSLEVVLCGGEAFPSSLLALLKQCCGAHIYNQYGPSEATIGVSSSLLDDAPVITAGSPMVNCRLYVLDKHRQPLPIGVFGELYIGGKCVARGYRNAPELTASAFMDNPFEPGERLYRTGDIAAWTPEGEIILKGREDGQIKLRGLRIELQEIASRLTMHPLIRDAAVHVVHHEGQELLTAYYISDASLEESELLAFAATYLPAYMVPSAFVRMEKIPLTPNGKIDTAKLPAPRFAAASSHTSTPVQKRILDIFGRVLKKSNLSPASDYFLSGGDSLNALETLGELETEFGVRLRVSDLYACRTAVQLEKRLGHHTGERLPAAVSIPKAPLLESYPLTPAQEGIYFQSQIDPKGISYNMPAAFRLTGEPDFGRLQTAFQRLVQGEEVFRTVFLPAGGTVRQKILPSADFSLDRIERDTFEQVKEVFVRPFDLSKAPLLRGALWRESEDAWILLVDLPHIVGDAITVSGILGRLDALYQGKPCVFPAITYTDYACWLADKGNAALEEQRDYWRGEMVPPPQLPDIPTDFPRPKRFDYSGRLYQWSLEETESRSYSEFCENRGITPYMLFSAAFGLLLSKLSGSSDFSVGTPVSGRLPELQEVSGLFIRTLPLRMKPEKELSVCEYLEQVKQSVIGLLDHGDFPLEEIISMTGLPRTLEHNPLYNAILSMRPVEKNRFTFDGKPLDAVAFHSGTAKTDLSLEICREKGCFCFCLEYASSLFSAETIALYSRCLNAILRELTADMGAQLKSVSGLAPADRIRLIERPNRLRTPYLDLPIDSQIDAVAEISPELPAIRFHGETMTFRELKERSDSLAAMITESGAKPGDRIGLLCRRSPDMLAAMIAICKAGCAYVPMLPSYPPNRMKAMLEISETELVLCDPGMEREASLQELPCRFVPMEKRLLSFVPAGSRSGEDLIYILFTSGSTGQPKGVMLKHKSISNLLGAMETLVAPIEGNVLCSTNMIFDIFISEGLIPLALGKCVIIADDEEMLLPWRMAGLIEKNNVKMMQFTPSRLQMCLGNDAFFRAAENIALTILVGEALSDQLLEKLQKSGCKGIANMYGPTEAAVYVTLADLSHAKRVHIGKALCNCRLYLLDEERRPVLPTARGELYLAGECLSPGYVSRQDLTDEMFVPDVFFPGEKMYRTGDVARLLADGNIDFLGRRDSQVKVNGQRVEPEEVTGKILASGLASEAVTLAVKDESAYVELRSFVAGGPDGQLPDPEKIRRFLSAELPPHMVPARIFPLREIPRTPSGKADQKFLAGLSPEEIFTAAPCRVSPPASAAAACVPAVSPAIQAECISPIAVPSVPHSSVESGSIAAPGNCGSTSVEAVPETEEKILTRLWKETLSKDQVDPDVSFFEQGGGSLAALNLLSQYFNQGWQITLSQFYDHPTIREQLALIAPEQHIAAAPSGAPEAALPSPVPLPVNGAETVRPLVSGKGQVLLTGATGFLGAHLLKSLLEAGYSKVICLIRGGDPARLQSALEWYFGSGWFSSHRSMLETLDGDVTAENFGLSPETVAALAGQVGLLLHSAADVRHYVSDGSSELTNRQGAANAASLAGTIGAKLAHISTASVCGEYLLAAPDAVRSFTELDCDIGQNWMENPYIRSKFLAEQLLLEECRKGLPVSIFRVGRLVGRSTDGVFQKNPSSNAFYGLVQGIKCLDSLPASLAERPVELTPVNECADAIVALLDAPGAIWHVFHPRTALMRDVASAVCRGPLPETDDVTFVRQLTDKLRAGMGSQLALLLEQFNRCRQAPSGSVIPDCSRTEEELLRRSFQWKEPLLSIILNSF